MSQTIATARPLRAPRRVPSVAPLRVIPTRIGTSGNGAFGTLCIALLTLGLVGLLLLNTALAEGSLTLGSLQKESRVLDARAGALSEQIAQASSSNALAARATSLGMVRAGQRGYIDLASGKVSGTAYPATTLQKVPIVVAPMPAPRVVTRLTSALDGATEAAVAAARAVARLAGTAATPKVGESAAPPSATETLDPISKPAGSPATTR
ncbi:MAG: hypothetical protein L0H79_05760 [Intrasporangium sp.]|uniref:hypothetical protein n=1 Tax=Intrasporangium sp. TaxID=1925024 RepID=UPI0026491D60|nr:hypothetical protein [Intrasporangium sp.]MDN5795243.1 hypothetical protein [Intrasporangium sp.]